MKTTTHTPEQIIKIIEHPERGEQSIAAICRERGIAENTFCRLPLAASLRRHASQRSTTAQGTQEGE
jgi:hypothetical protein